MEGPLSDWPTRNTSVTKQTLNYAAFYRATDLEKPFSKPVSLNYDTKQEKQEAETLVTLFKEVRQKMTEYVELDKRQLVVEVIKNMVQDCINTLLVLDHRPASLLEKRHAVVLPFGSHLFGVCTNESDLDLLVITSKVVSRQYFMTEFSKYLQRYQNSEQNASCQPSQQEQDRKLFFDGVTVEVKNVLVLSEAFVPLVKLDVILSATDPANNVGSSQPMERYSQKVDILFARLDKLTISAVEQDLKHDEILIGCDRQSVLSLNGYRVCQRMLNLVSRSTGKRKLFTDVLMVIKFWAKTRLLYSNVVGFFGGINLALLVCKVCCLYPNKKSLSFLVTKFFTYCSQFQWVKGNPLILCPLPNSSTFSESKLEVLYQMQWNPMNNVKDQEHLMPILTPVFPVMNSMHTVTTSSLQFIKQEFAAAFLALSDERDENRWQKFLTNRFDFFTGFDGYLVFTLSATATSDSEKEPRYATLEDELNRWSNSVFHKLRHLVVKLESVEDITPRPYPGILRPHSENGMEALRTTCFLVVGLQYEIENYLRGKDKKSKNLADPVELSQFQETHGPEINIDINAPLQEFASLVSTCPERKLIHDMDCAVFTQQEMTAFLKLQKLAFLEQFV